MIYSYLYQNKCYFYFFLLTSRTLCYIKAKCNFGLIKRALFSLAHLLLRHHAALPVRRCTAPRALQTHNKTYLVLLYIKKSERREAFAPRGANNAAPLITRVHLASGIIARDIWKIIIARLSLFAPEKARIISAMPKKRLCPERRAARIMWSKEHSPQIAKLQRALCCCPVQY
jgi:hypothetical protein